MRVVAALGGNALLRRGEPMTVENQVTNVALACAHLAPLTESHDLVISHGNGPQIGLLALEGAAYKPVPAYPLDVLGAETQGMVGYLIERELRNRLSPDRAVATLLTMIEVDPADPAFGRPTKPIGPVYSESEAAEHQQSGWIFRPDGDGMRRVVPSPAPRRIVEHPQVLALVDSGCVVICAGGGGIPTAVNDAEDLYGVEAVIDKDLASCVLAIDVAADVFVMATDTPAVYLGFGSEAQRRITAAHPDAILSEHHDEFAEGSMLPKVTAACNFARESGKAAVIGQLADIEAMVAGTAGTRISTDVTGVETEPAA
jgi:carbamate kinase